MAQYPLQNYEQAMARDIIETARSMTYATIHRDFDNAEWEVRMYNNGAGGWWAGVYYDPQDVMNQYVFQSPLARYRSSALFQLISFMSVELYRLNPDWVVPGATWNRVR